MHIWIFQGRFDPIYNFHDIGSRSTSRMLINEGIVLRGEDLLRDPTIEIMR
jgi:hypothetical protein